MGGCPIGALANRSDRLVAEAKHSAISLVFMYVMKLFFSPAFRQPL